MWTYFTQRGTHLSSLQTSILLTVLYADIFGHALNAKELYHYLIISSPSNYSEYEENLDALKREFLSSNNGFITWKGREHLADKRLKLATTQQTYWKWARFYGRCLRHIPYLRMVAVSGSLSIQNAHINNEDIDLFCITETNRLWIVRIYLAMLRILSNIAPVHICANYILARNSLIIPDQNLFTAFEIAKVKPLWGRTTFLSFLNANAWVKRYLPNIQISELTSFLTDAQPSLLNNFGEKILHGKFGDYINHASLRFFHTIQPIRLKRKLGWSKADIIQAYQPNRQIQVHGGYVHVIKEHYKEHLNRLFPQETVNALITQLFPEQLFSAIPDSNFKTWFEEKYPQGKKAKP